MEENAPKSLLTPHMKLKLLERRRCLGEESESKTIRKCVFFASLELKPAPQIFEHKSLIDNVEEETVHERNDIRIKGNDQFERAIVDYRLENNSNTDYRLIIDDERDYSDDKQQFDYSNPLLLGNALEASLDEKKKHSKRAPQCKICFQTFSTYSVLKKHKFQHEGDKAYPCQKCDICMPSLDQLIGHLREHEGKRPFVCKKCNKDFDTFGALEEHQVVHVLRKIGCSMKKSFKCDACLKEFGKLCDLERHMRVHTGEKPAICKICNRRFQQTHNLNKHLLIHSKEKSFQCAVCSKRFGRNDVLNRHLLTHCIEKPNHCTYCMKSFIRVSQLVAHTIKHHPEAVS